MQGDDRVPFVNRTGETTLLLDRWRMASSGHGQIVLLSGEAGIGKSRLLRAFVDRLAGEDFLCHSFHCTPFHRSSTLYPLLERLRRRSEEHTSELQSLMRISYAVFCLKKKHN